VPAVVVALDSEECVLFDVGEIVPGRVWMSSFLQVAKNDSVTASPKQGRASSRGAAHTVGGTEFGEFFRGILTAAVLSIPIVERMTILVVS